MVHRAKARGLSGLAVTDHNSLAGSRCAAEFDSDEFMVIPGMEISTELGDLIGLFIQEEIALRDPIAAADAIAAQGGVAILPHPFLQAKSYPDEFLRRLDAVEVLNPRASCFARFRQAQAQVADIRREYGLGAVGGSDAHSYAEIGIVRNLVPSLA